MPGVLLSLAQLETLVGTELGQSSWIDVPQARIDAFADVTLDRQFIHIDPTTARASPFGGTIAHGFLTLSLMSAMAQECVPGIEGTKAAVNYGFNSVRFMSPVRSGTRVRGRFALKSVTERSQGVIQTTLGATVEIEAEPKPALVAEWLTLYYL